MGADTFDRIIDEDAPTFTRHLHKNVFSAFSSRLNHLLSHALRYRTVTGWGFALNRSDYSDLLRALYKISKELGELITIDGLVPPPLPLWGPKGDATAIYDMNDFEIVGACFRTEVEHFLMFYDKYYDFVTDTVRGEEPHQIPDETALSDDEAEELLRSPKTPPMRTGLFSRDAPPHFSVKTVSARGSQASATETPTRARQLGVHDDPCIMTQRIIWKGYDK